MSASFIQIAAAYSEAKKPKKREKLQRDVVKRMEELADCKKKLNRKYVRALEQISTQLVNRQYKISSTKCPECYRYFLLITLEGQELNFCQHCRSFWFDTGELRHFTNLFKDVPGENSKSRKSKYFCPSCRAQMRECAFLKRGNLLVNKCPKNHGVYLESGEFNRALELSQHHLANSPGDR